MSAWGALAHVARRTRPLLILSGAPGCGTSPDRIGSCRRRNKWVPTSAGWARSRRRIAATVCCDHHTVCDSLVGMSFDTRLAVSRLTTLAEWGLGDPTGIATGLTSVIAKRSQHASRPHAPAISRIVMTGARLRTILMRKRRLQKLRKPRALQIRFETAPPLPSQQSTIE